MRFKCVCLKRKARLQQAEVTGSSTYSTGLIRQSRCTEVEIKVGVQKTMAWCCALHTDEQRTVYIQSFIEAGESLEEAVRRETFEEVGIKVGEIVYHSSQPWPVGPAGMSCQLMIGFLAYAKTFDIHVDGVELQDAQWYSREQVKQSITHSAYREQQESSLAKIWQADFGGERKISDGAPPRGNSRVFVPGPYAIAHHLIVTWAHQSPEVVLSKV